MVGMNRYCIHCAKVMTSRDFGDREYLGDLVVLLQKLDAILREGE